MRKSTAPALIARTLIGMSPCPVRKTIGNVCPASVESMLQFEPVEARQGNVEHEAPWCARIAVRHECFGRAERLDAPSVLAQDA